METWIVIEKWLRSHLESQDVRLSVDCPTRQALAMSCTVGARHQVLIRRRRSRETNELVSYGVCFSGVRLRDSAGLTPAEFFRSSSSIKDSTFQLSVLAGCEQGHTFGLSVFVQVPKGMESRPDVLNICFPFVRSVVRCWFVVLPCNGELRKRPVAAS